MIGNRTNLQYQKSTSYPIFLYFDEKQITEEIAVSKVRVLFIVNNSSVGRMNLNNSQRRKSPPFFMASSGLRQARVQFAA